MLLSSDTPVLPRKTVAVIFPALLFVLWCTGPGVSQKAPDDGGLPKYDLHTETKLKGTVEEIRLPPKANDVVHLMMKNGEDLVDLYFCPKSFMDDMGVAFSKGDEVAFTGSKVKYGGADLILAREVVKGSDTLVLRDDKGNPVWSWKH